jgi:hypothetical protein
LELGECVNGGASTNYEVIGALESGAELLYGLAALTTSDRFYLHLATR